MALIRPGLHGIGGDASPTNLFTELRDVQPFTDSARANRIESLRLNFGAGKIDRAKSGDGCLEGNREKPKFRSDGKILEATSEVNEERIVMTPSTPTNYN